MRYELLIRPIQAATRFAPEAIREALAAAELGAEGVLPAEVDLGSGKVVVEGFEREGGGKDGHGHHQDKDDHAQEGAWEGLNLSFPMGLQSAEGDRAVGMAFGLAQALGAQVYDPQVGRVVTPSDHERILATWRRSWAFQADVVGAVDLGSGDPGQPEPAPGFLGGRTGLALTIIFFLLLLVYLVRACAAGDDDPRPTLPHPPVQTGAEN